MNKEILGNKALEILTSLQSVVKDGYAMAADQLPQIAQEYVLFGRVYYTAAFSINMLIFLFLWVTAIVIWRKIDRDFSDGPALVGFVAAMLYSLIVWPIVMLETTKPMILAWAAPKIFLITEIMSLVK